MKPTIRRVLIAALLLSCLALAGCARTEAPAATSGDGEPAVVQPVQGTDLNSVTITEEASRNIGLETGTVLGRSSAGASSVPMTAVIYDPAGRSYVYETSATLTFVRAPIAIGQTTSQTAYLVSGPAVGTTIVTVGAPELLGAEYGVGGE
jgi:hypothetical protein